MSLFIVIEGLDASGKATQSKILAARLGAKLYSFPRYDTPIGKIIKAHLKGEILLVEKTVDEDHEGAHAGAPEDPIMFQCLMLADKAHAAAEIQKHRAQRTDVVCDRWIPSARCYGAADGIDPDWLRVIHEVFPQADLNIFLDVAPEEALRRRPDARDRYERDREKQKRVGEEYRKLWATQSARRYVGRHYVTVNGDGGGGPGSIEVVSERIWAAVEAYRKENP